MVPGSAAGVARVSSKRWLACSDGWWGNGVGRHDVSWISAEARARARIPRTHTRALTCAGAGTHTHTHIHAHAMPRAVTCGGRTGQAPRIRSRWLGSAERRTVQLCCSMARSVQLRQPLTSGARTTAAMAQRRATLHPV
ncbi:MAG: hypothetical protein EOO65_03950 [Methanosarcinales archaeon]|nr:MAG: hypothetical protein EOO65_03950 [Methanosarcinales archaeon]